uniref:D-lactate dehydrogenase (cytochrome) n=1 Tax=Corethron hystrix TaxID=216773 RepID=A0A7S1BM94_9STRA|mmetsp:Transcript_32253/g.74259  ORF Transcript_32253/g.74259 Transcript_32253/m.74259 type:complete len:344 (+) Transcript_32253:131-1162(+)
MVDPGAPTATIAGMVACGASGTSAVKYGTIRDNVLACTIVLADGSIVNVGTRSLKNSAGFDLRGLICGSEGTLGVIVSLTVRLHPLPGCTTAVVADFECLRGAANAVGEVVAGCPGALARCELLDEMSVQAFNQYISSRDNATVEDALQERPHLFLEFEGPTDDVVTAYVKVATEILNDHGCMTLKTASGEKERRDLWSARHSLYYAALALRGGDAAGFVTDACVPLGSLPDLIEATTEDVKRLGVVGPCFGHAGDGNFHCILPILEGDSEKYRAAVNEVNDNLIRRTMRAGGSCTGEHGVGVGKVKYLEWQYGAGACEMMKAIKMAVDPKNIMNPGKIVMHD